MCETERERNKREGAPLRHMCETERERNKRERAHNMGGEWWENSATD